MAGDWIKMRVWLCRDPKVIRMADTLAADRDFMLWLTDPVRQSCKDTAYEHVTRNVTVALCVTALLVTWGTAREQGNREEDDLVLSHCDLSTLDAMADLPGFGDAMASVEWASEREDGSLIFPKFFKDNESPDDRHKRQNAQRQAKFRDKQSNASNNVTDNVTVTTEKRREEKSKPQTPSESFTRFWAAWPKSTRKGGKPDCLKVWVKEGFDPIADQIIAHVEAMKLTIDWRKNAGEFIPGPLPYLNGKKWDGAEVPTAEPRRAAV
jgi:biotin carboxyl carrier protein